jgi:NAD(P)-dependent dehydrogenase (short-subunit alcohol dehydrogenase family)
MSKGKAIVITGASTGIGRACALHLAAEGFQVFAGVRKSEDGDALSRDASATLTPLMLDVTKEDSIDAAVKTVSEITKGELYGLMNNAGIGGGGPIEVTPIEETRKLIEVNLIGVLASTKAFLPLLRQGRGRIVNTGSIFGLCALPTRSNYAASKFALEGITDTMRLEFRPFGMSVSIVEPGAIETPIWQKGGEAREQVLATADPDILALYAPVGRFFKRTFYDQSKLPPEKVADVVLDAFTAKRPKARYLIGKDARRLALIERLPTRLRDWVFYRMIYKPRG